MKPSGPVELASKAWDRRAAVSGAGVVAFFYTGTGPVEVQTTPTASTRNPPGEQPAVPSTLIRNPGLGVILRNDAVPDCVEHQFGGVVQIELLQNVCAVGVDGGRTHAQHVSDLFVAVALGNQLKNLTFPLR
jgi:hypothetical protein